MRRTRPPAIAVLALALAACGGQERPATTAPAGWRAVATPGDRERLRGWRDAWTRALAAAQRAGHGAEIIRQGALLAPDAALPNPTPPPGAYRCRMTKLGAQSAGLLDYIAYPAFACTVMREGDVLSLAKTTGSQRPVGLLFPAEGSRLVFLGTMILSDERSAQQYGRDPERDMIGAFERIGPARWRLVLPSPRWESLLDVLELVPA